MTMKKLSIILVICLLYGGGRLFAQKYQPKYLRENNQVFKELTSRTTENGWIEFKKEAKLNPNTFFKDYGNSLGLRQHYDFKPLKDETDNKQIRHQRFQLHYKNIPVEGVEFGFHSKEGFLNAAHGRIPENLEFDISKPMPEPKALDIALADRKVTLNDLEKKGRKKPEGRLILANTREEVVASNYRLTYVFDVYGNETLNAYSIYVDASSGEIVKRIPLIHNCFGRFDHTTSVKDEENINMTAPITLTKPLVTSMFRPNYDRYLGGQPFLNLETEDNPETVLNSGLVFKIMLLIRVET